MIKRHSSEGVATNSIVEPLDRWHADHRNFSRLLDLIEQEVDVFHGGRRPDYELLRSIAHKFPVAEDEAEP